MALKFVNICGPIVANTAYVNNQLVARDVAATLPEIVPTTVDVNAMGTWSIPNWLLLEDMQASITKIGIDQGLASMLRPEPISLELRMVQSVTDANGNTRNVGVKAFMRGTPAGVPGFSVSLGEASENEVSISVTRYQLVVDGVEMILVDRLAQRLRINGKDYASDLANLL